MHTQPAVSILILGMAIALAAPAQAQAANSEVQLNTEARRELATLLASALVLADSDAVTLGFLSFDPGRFLPGADEAFGSAESLSRRRSLRVFNLPTRWRLASADGPLSHTLKFNVSMLELEQHLAFANGNGDQAEDSNKSRVFNLFGGYRLGVDVSSLWRFALQGGTHVQRYDNNYAYNNRVSQALRGDIEGLLFNNSAWAVVGSLMGQATYNWRWQNLPWRWQATYTYYRGSTTSTTSRLPEARPETWTLANELMVEYELPDFNDSRNQLRLGVARIDLGGDATRTFNTHQYYLASVALLIETSNSLQWLDNLGVAVSANVGSALAGGSLQLLYNEEF